MAELTGNSKLPKYSVSGPDGSTPRTSAGVRAVSQDAAHWLQWLTDLLYEVIGRYQVIGGVDATTDTITVESHGFSANAPVRVLAGVDGTLPGGLSAGVVYYVKSPAADTLKLSATAGGSTIDITSPSSGECYLIKAQSPELYLPINGDLPAGKLSTVMATLLSMCGQVTSGVTNTWNSINDFLQTVTFSGGLTVPDEQLAAILGTLSLGRALLVIPGTAGDADSTLDVSKPIWWLDAASALRADTLRSGSAPLPSEGQMLFVRMSPGGAAARRLVRENGTIIATLSQDATDPAFALLIWHSSAWRLLFYTDHVTPGPGAA